MGERTIDQQIHRQLSVECFNRVWDLLETRARDAAEDRLLREMAHASLFHWLCREDCSAQNLSVGLWQVSRVHAVLGDAASALRYAEECIAVAETDPFPAFYLGYGFEAAARAELLTGNADRFQAWMEKAREALEAVDDPSSRALLKADLDALQEAQPPRSAC